nr:immunoglobulin heavy chain junction region [Macaca mulatta]MOV49215.1 immunoglobulin heavy chain junction region [Macaca mulatta]MOV49249.1 immunoglobulin heavy chain junction region [Macaca mulatta]MOV49381.1 immunoglobulin heavy chain junction region [Macaca mulatta]MOV49635.1 immunoglobulin heavy chain junction region [Macaca mulatta]
CASPWGPW